MNIKWIPKYTVASFVFVPLLLVGAGSLSASAVQHKAVPASSATLSAKNLLPTKDNSYSLGSSIVRWKELYVGTQIRIGNMLITPTGITSISSSLGITIGKEGSTGYLTTALPIKFPDGTVQSSAATSITGETGPAGPTGSTGAVGATGPLGAQGIQGLQGIAGVPGVTGFTGATGATGAIGSQGTNGSNGFIPLSICRVGGASLCVIGSTGPGGGTIFFVDYNNQFSGFDYLEAAPSDIGAMTWASTTTVSVPTAGGWTGRGVGTGLANTNAIVAAFPGGTTGAAYSAHIYTNNGKSDWFLPSFGELKLMDANLQGLAGISLGSDSTGFYWSSSETDASNAWSWWFRYGYGSYGDKSTATNLVRPIREF